MPRANDYKISDKKIEEIPAGGGFEDESIYFCNRKY